MEDLSSGLMLPNEDFLESLTNWPKDKPLPDELFERAFDISDSVERTKYIESARIRAKVLGRAKEFSNILDVYRMDYLDRMRDSENVTRFTEQPMELQCGQWCTNDSGVYTIRTERNLSQTKVMACSHPIMPVRILKNVDTGEERVTLAYFKYGEWQHVTVNREVCADNAMIVKILSKIGIEVTSENAKYMVRYISDCIGLNPAKLKPIRAINRLGWCGNEFMPYAKDIAYDGDKEYEPVYKNICTGGDFEKWKEHCSVLRKNKIVRLAFAASAASILIEPLNILPFVFHIWSGESGTCKTVAVMAAMSIWGNPKMGGLVKTMNTTKVGIMRTSAFLHNLPYAGDELQTMKDKWTTSFDQLIYQITEGIDRGRGRASGGVEETKTWRCSYLFTGEEPITKQNSRSGAKNRVIEIEVEEKLMEDGNSTVSLLTENYGHAGPMLVDYVQQTETKKLREEYKRRFDEMCALDTTEKQAMAMSDLLLGDWLLVNLIFTDETPLAVDDVKEYLRSAKEVDVAERAYQATLNWIAKNPSRFEEPGENNRGEVWGKIEDEIAIINKDVLCDFLERGGFDYAAISKKWASREWIMRNSQGRYIHCTKAFNIKANYIKLRMGDSVPDNHDDKFVKIEETQLELPFD